MLKHRDVFQRLLRHRDERAFLEQRHSLGDGRGRILDVRTFLGNRRDDRHACGDWHGEGQLVGRERAHARPADQGVLASLFADPGIEIVRDKHPELSRFAFLKPSLGACEPQRQAAVRHAPRILDQRPHVGVGLLLAFVLTLGRVIRHNVEDGPALHRVFLQLLEDRSTHRSALRLGRSNGYILGHKGRSDAVIDGLQNLSVHGKHSCRSDGGSIRFVLVLILTGLERSREVKTDL